MQHVHRKGIYFPALLLSLLFIISGCSSLLERYSLTIILSGEGQVYVDPSPSFYRKGEAVRLTAQGGEGYLFSHWEGDLTGTENPVTLIMESSKTITAVFQRLRYPLLVETVGGGVVHQGLVQVQDRVEYEHGTWVQLTAQPAEGWYFHCFEGDLTGEENPQSLLMDESKKVTAIFRLRGEATITGTISIYHNFPTSVVDSPLYSSPAARGGIHLLQSERLLNPAGMEGEMIMGFFPEISPYKKEEILQALGYPLLDVQKTPQGTSVLVEVFPDGMQEAIRKASSFSGVRYAEANNQLLSLSTFVPNDPFYSEQWNLPLIRLPQAWSVTRGSSQVRVAVLDTGIDASHPDLTGRIDTENGYNFIADSTDTHDDHGHGTHVAGVIGAVTNNSLGVAGILWEGGILPVKVLDHMGRGTNWYVAKGIRYAAGLLEEPANPQPVDIINLSLGGYHSEDLQGAVLEAYGEGVLIVTASGNTGQGILYPAYYPQTIAVGAVGYNGGERPVRASYSGYGPMLDFVAPGGEPAGGSSGEPSAIYSTYPQNRYRHLQGTSMAAPHVSGVMGLMLAAGIPRTRVLEILQRTAVDLGQDGFDEEHGYGLINGYWAVNNVQEIRLFVGERVGDQIESVAETTIPLQPEGGPFSFTPVPEGTYRLFAFIDVQNTGRIDEGDYLAQSGLIDFVDGETVQIDLQLEEVP